MKRLKLALIGAGRRAQAHLPVIALMNDVFDFVAICDINEKVAQETAEKYRVRGYTDIRKMVREEKLDVADIVTPADSHHAIASFLAENGINIICETPITITIPLADLMIGRAKENNVKLEVAENVCRFPIERMKRRIIEEGVIGDVIRVYGMGAYGGYHGMNGTRVLSGGVPKRVRAISRRDKITDVTDRAERHHTEDSWILGIVEYDNGVVGVTDYSNLIHGRVLGRGQSRIYQVDGTAGTIAEDVVHIVPFEERHKGGRSIGHKIESAMIKVEGKQILKELRVDTDPSVVWENPYTQYPTNDVAVVDELMSIARAVIEDSEPEYGGEAGRMDQATSLTLQESARRGGEPIELPTNHPTPYEEEIHENFRKKYGMDPFDTDALLTKFFPRL